jgi:putative flippase GtrA
MKEVLKSETGKNFYIYTGVGAFVSILNILLLYLFIDILRIPTIISSSIVVVGSFFFRFFLYKWTGFTR